MKTIHQLALGFICGGLFLTGCSSDEPVAPPFELSRSEASLIEAQNDISLGMLAEYEQSVKGNFGFSPFSMQQALSMLGNGVSAADQDKFMNIFGGCDVATMNSLNQQLNYQLPNRDPKQVQISIANSLWLNDKIDFKAEFANTLGNYYNATAKKLDFAAANAASEVNNWVAKQTRNGITKIVPEDMGSSDNACYIANALYFKGQWQREFNAEATRPLPFYDAQGRQISTVDMMNSGEERSFDYYGGENFNMVTLPYGNGSFEMAILLPDQGATVTQVIEKLDKNSLEQAFARRFKQELIVLIPRFELTTNSEISKNLKNLGLPLSSVSYSGITDTPLNFNVYHGFNICVDEKGTVIKAATVEEGWATSPGPSVSKVFKADRPFIFIVRECSSGAIIGMGVVRNPAK